MLTASVFCVLCGADRARPAAQGARHDGATPLRIGVLRGGSYHIATLQIETYVAQVVAGEAAPKSDPAALEALAIAVRTFALANRGRHGAEGFDLCDQTHCQVLRPSTAATERAAEATAGQVLLHEGALASIYYSASCGGRTEVPSAVWPGADDPSYLPSQVDDACGGDPVWTAELTGADLQRALSAAGFRGTLRALRIRSRDASGRVAHLAIEGLVPDDISGQDLRVALGRTLGWQHLKSTAFDLVRTGQSYRFSGHGSGHGVGMCVIGATRLAARGESARRILQHYYPGLRIDTLGPRLTALPPLDPAIGPPRTANPANAGASNIPSGRPALTPLDSDISLSLPDQDERERSALRLMATRVRTEIARTLGIEAPRPLSLRFHATTRDYERATGQPWFTSASVVDRQAHFVPLALLRDRGMLERVVRQQVVHLLADPVLDRGPAWVRVGAALFYSDPAPASSGETRRAARVTCPADTELMRPVSAGALTDAYARARACFALQIASGKSWREVR